jgi:predicted DNA-binding transcriptional regulator AlpA
MSEPQVQPAVEEKVDSVLISVDVLASMIDLSPRTVWRLLSARQIPAPVRIGANVRWRKKEILTWIADGCPACDKR